MAADILQIVYEFLRVQDYASSISGGPMYQFLFAVFFPTILLISIVIVLGERLSPEHKGMTSLFTVAIYIFIIVYPPDSERSLYSIFAPLATFWWIFAIIIGLIWVFLGKFKQSTLGKTFTPKSLKDTRFRRQEGTIIKGSTVTGKLKRKWTGEEKEIEDAIKLNLSMMENIVNDLKDPPQGTDTAKLRETFISLRNTTMELISDFETIHIGSGIKLKHDPKSYGKKLERLNRELVYRRKAFK